jgi:hypothetical protein
MSSTVKEKMKQFVAIALLLVLSSCGYQFGEGGFASQYQTISVPFIKGDWNGDMTSTLIEQIAQSGSYTYCRDGGALTLQVCLMEFTDENVGFRYDRNKQGELRKSIIPVETRIETKAEVKLIEAASGRVLLGPVIITAGVEFDHEYYSSWNGINSFSLGQLSDYDAAYDAMYHPLNVALSRKIVDFVVDSW